MSNREELNPTGNLFGNLAGGDIFKSIPGDSLGPPREEGDWAKWQSILDSIRDGGTKRARKLAKTLKCKIEITGFQSNGLIDADVIVAGKRFELNIDFDFAQMRISQYCSCGIDYHYSCEHILLVAQNIQAKLSKFGIAKPDNHVREPKLFRVLDRLLEQKRDVASVVLPPEKKQNQTRIVWRLTTHPHVQLVPVQQKLNKKGTAWTKGKKLKFQTVFDQPQRYQCTAVDRRVLACVDYDNYNYDMHVELLDAVDCLVGHDLFQINDDPTEVIRRSLGLRVEKTDNLYVLRVALDGVVPTSYLFCPAGLLAFHLDQHWVAVIHCGPMQVELVKTLVQEAVGFSEATLHALMQRVEVLRQFIPVTLPEELGGPCVTEDCPLVVQLRARKTGGLDAAIRVRDSVDRLAQPGEGLLQFSGTRDGKPIQIVRDAESERRRATDLLGELQLTELRPVNGVFSIDDFDQSLALLSRIEHAIAEEHCELQWDPSSIERLSVLGSATSQNMKVQVTKKKDWFGLSGTIKVGASELSLVDVLKSLGNRNHGRYIEIQPGTWAEFNDAFRKKLEELREVVHMNRSQLSVDATAAGVVRKLDDGQLEFTATKAWRECLTRLDRAEELNPDPAPTFKATLRDYQLDGYRWLRRLAEWRVGACLADDMGLGKTVQMLAVLIDRQTEGPALVIAPTSVGFNWHEETQRFAPDLNPVLYRESNRAELLKSVGPGDVIICSYGLALRDAKILGDVQWNTLVLDEAQAIKNSRSKTAMAIRDLQADWRVAMTGTPMENHLGELWSLFRAISPGVLGSWERFRDRFATPIEKHNDNGRRKALSRLIKPFILRRTKSEVLTELPERTEVNLYVDLDDGERAAYDQMRLTAAGELKQIEEITNTGDQRFRILALLTKMRQLACHRGLVDPSWTGSSAKLDMLIEKLRELREEGHRALVFSQFTSHLALIRKACDEAEITYQYLDGKSSPKSRKQSVEAFQGGAGDAFLISLKAGGTGLNITAADYVIHTDPWWNPAVEDQATDRAHRIGQQRPVMVYRMIARGTIEEQILELHKDKRDLVHGILEGTEAAAKLSTAELAKLIQS